MKILPMIIAALFTGCATQQRPLVQVPFPNPTTSEEKYANYVYLKEASAIMASAPRQQQLNYMPPNNGAVPWVPGNAPSDSAMFRPGSPYNPINVNVVPSSD